MKSTVEIDDIDLKILTLLMQDAQMPYTEIAKKVYVSGGTVHVRMKKLEQAGIVESSQININYSKLGYDIKAFLGIYLEKSTLYQDVVDELEKIPEVISVDYTTGNYSMFVKIISKDTNHLRTVLYDKIQKVSGIERTETIISLEESINRSLTLFDGPIGDDD